MITGEKEMKFFSRRKDKEARPIKEKLAHYAIGVPDDVEKYFEKLQRKFGWNKAESLKYSVMIMAGMAERVDAKNNLIIILETEYGVPLGKFVFDQGRRGFYAADDQIESV